MRKRTLSYLLIGCVLMGLLFCKPPLQSFLIANYNLNVKEHAFYATGGKITCNYSAGYRTYGDAIDVVIRIEFKNLDTGLFTLNTEGISLVSRSYDYKIEYMNSPKGIMFEFYKPEKTSEYNPSSPNLEIESKQKSWLYIAAHADLPKDEDLIQLQENELMTLTIEDGTLDHQEVKFEEILFVPEFAIKNKRK